MTKGYLKRVLLALDYLINTILCGWHDEWVSSRAWRMRDKSRLWRSAWVSIDWVFGLFGQKNHCFWSYVSEQMQRAMPPERRN